MSANQVTQLLALLEPVAAGDEAALAQARALIATLGDEARPLALALLTRAEEEGHSKRRLPQVAKLAELGLSTAELVHELRQPLSGIAGFAQLAATDPASPDAATWLKEISTQASRMEELLDRVRRHNRPSGDGAGPADLNAVVKDAVAVFHKLPRGVRLELELGEGLPLVRGEPNRLVQVITNLVGNARDAMDGRRGVIRVKTFAEGGGASAVVMDEGVGVAPEIREKLFQPYVTTKGDRGTGLGLYICREIARQSGGTLALLATPPSGASTAFRLDLQGAGKGPRPMTPPPEVKPAALAPLPHADSSLEALRQTLSVALAALPSERHALVVEDEEVIRRMVRVLLAREPGVVVHEAVTGEQAEELLGSVSPQVVLCDKNLPGISGLEVLKAVRAKNGLAETLLMTGYPSLKSVLEALEAGASDYLVKPFDHVERLRDRLRAAMDRNRRRTLLARAGAEIAELAEALAAQPHLEPALRRALAPLTRQAASAPARLLAHGDDALVSLLAAGRLQAELVAAPGALVARAAGGEVDVVLLGGIGDPGGATTLLAALQKAPFPPAVVALASGITMDQTLGLLRAGAADVFTEPPAASELARRLARVIGRRREDVKAAALGVVLQHLGLEAPRVAAAAAR